MQRKRQKNSESSTTARTEFRLEFPRCWVCGDDSTDVHEIARGPARHISVLDRAAWVMLCRRCHNDLGGLTAWPVERQYALKALWDPEWYDRPKLNTMRCRAAEAITEGDVWRQVRELLKRMRWAPFW